MVPASVGPADRDFDVVVVGELNPDIIVSDADPVPRFGQVERLVRSIEFTVGSSSAIVACGTARLGLRTSFVGVVGDDLFGRYMLEALAALGVDVGHCHLLPDVPTGASVILSGAADRAIMTALGTIPALTNEMIPDYAIKSARHLHVGSFFLQDKLRPDLPELLRAARSAGLTTSIDCNWDPRETWDGGLRESLAEVDLFFANSEEMMRITGAGDDLRAVDRLGPVGPSGRGTVVVKRGREGGLARSPHERAQRAALSVDTIDTTGAGDSFDAGFIYGWLSGMPLQGALDLAVACGSLSTLAVGGTARQPTLDEALNAAGLEPESPPGSGASGGS